MYVRTTRYENSWCKDSGEKETERSKMELRPAKCWQNSQGPEEMGWTGHIYMVRMKDERFPNRVENRNRDDADNDEDHSYKMGRLPKERDTKDEKL